MNIDAPQEGETPSSLIAFIKMAREDSRPPAVRNNCRGGACPALFIIPTQSIIPALFIIPTQSIITARLICSPHTCADSILVV